MGDLRTKVRAIMALGVAIPLVLLPIFSRSSMNTLIFHRIVDLEIEVRRTLVDKLAW